MSIPFSTCVLTMSRHPLATSRSKAAASIGWPRALAFIMSSTGTGRGRLPTCVVRMRSTFCCTVMSASSWSFRFFRVMERGPIAPGFPRRPSRNSAAPSSCGGRLARPGAHVGGDGILQQLEIVGRLHFLVGQTARNQHRIAGPQTDQSALLELEVHPAAQDIDELHVAHMPV